MKRHLLIVALSFLALHAQAHIRSKASGSLVPRSNSDGLKTAPCGGVARGNSSATFAPGATVTVNWEETINHPGRFEIYFSPANDSNWQLLKSIPDNKNSTNDLPHQYSTTINLPQSDCEACTLQLIQVMEENPANPSYYYSCSNIRIQSAAPSPVPQPGPTPYPDPCH